MEKVRLMRWRIIVLKKPIVIRPKMRPFSSHCVTLLRTSTYFFLMTV